MSLQIGKNILLDYFSFTVPYSEEMMARVFSALDEEKVQKNGYGGMGYTESAFVLDGGRVFWHPGKPDLGIHIRLNSASIAISGFTAVGLLNRAFDMRAKVTRLDIAFDDLDGLLDMDVMYQKILSGELVTRFRKVTRIAGSRLEEAQKIGDTINIGSRSSNAFVRMYDKKLERESRGVDVTGIEKWVRVEIETKKEKSHLVASLLAGTALEKVTDTPGELCADLLYGLLDFKEVNEEDENKSRWDTSDWWYEFVGASRKLTLAIPPQHKILEDTKRWIAAQVSTSLAMIILSYPDDYGVSGYEFIMDCIVAGEKNLNKSQQMRLDLYNSQQKQKQKAG